MTRPERRMDQGKSPVVDGCFRYFPQALLAVGLVSKFGCDKYGVELKDKGWLSYTESELINSEGRHILKAEIEGKYDAESQLLHKAHKAWNALADLEKELMAGTELANPAAPDVRGNAVDTGLTLTFGDGDTNPYPPEFFQDKDDALFPHGVEVKD